MTTAEALEKLTDRIARLEKAARQPPRKAWTARETAEQLGIPYKTVLELIHTDEIRAIRAGRHYVIPDAELHRLLDT